MAGSREAPLDEIQFRREDVLQYWGGVHTNSSKCLRVAREQGVQLIV